MAWLTGRHSLTGGRNCASLFAGIWTAPVDITSSPGVQTVQNNKRSDLRLPGAGLEGLELESGWEDVLETE